MTFQGIASMTTIQVADNGGALTVDNGGTFVVQVDGTALTRLTDIETNTDSGAVVGNGAAATAQRVTIANDSTGIVSLTTSTASIGKLAANSGVDIGDVDVTTINGVAPAFGTGLRGATVQRVTIATDDVVPASLSGTWTVQPGNTANTTAWLVTGTGGTFPITDSNGSLTVDAPVGTPVFVRLSDGASAITSLPVSLACVPSHAVTNAGTFAVQPTPATSGGLTMHTAVSAATNNATNVKASAGQGFGLQLMKGIRRRSW